MLIFSSFRLLTFTIDSRCYVIPPKGSFWTPKLLTYICFILGRTPGRPSGSSHSAFKEADGGICSYNCKSDGGCEVHFKANGLYSGASKGSCFPQSFGGDCIGTLRFCDKCISRCPGNGEYQFLEEVWGINCSSII